MSQQDMATLAGDLRGSEKLNEVSKLLETLGTDLEKSCLISSQRDALLEQLKIYGRDPENADPIFTKKGIQILARHAFNSPSSTTSHQALRCLANAMWLKSTTRQIFVDLQYEQRLCSSLKLDNREDEFLISRIIFLTTYGTNINLEALIDKYYLAEYIIQNISKHAASFNERKETSQRQAEAITDMALIETLKLFFNISNFCSKRKHVLKPAIPSILVILRKRHVLPNKPLEAPIGPLVNCLINFDLQALDIKQALFPENEPECAAERLVELLGLAIKSYKEDELDHQVLPLLTVIRKVYAVAPMEIKNLIRIALLPGDKDREKPLGMTESLASKLLGLSTSPLAPKSREAISSLLFEMSDEDARKFVQNVGYGFASGFLFQHNISIPENALDPRSSEVDGRNRNSDSHDLKINLITGQAREFEQKNDGPEMTREEKEREAEKLLVLFERLKKNGVISAENPLAKAQREGVFEDSRFTELDSDDDE